MISLAAFAYVSLQGALLQPVSARELRLLLDGVVMVNVSSTLEDHTEIFHPGGRYELQGRAIRFGSYTIQKNVLCRWAGADPAMYSSSQCLGVFQNNNGQLFISDMDDGAGMHVSEVRFAPFQISR